MKCYVYALEKLSFYSQADVVLACPDTSSTGSTEPGGRRKSASCYFGSSQYENAIHRNVRPGQNGHWYALPAGSQTHNRWWKVYRRVVGRYFAVSNPRERNPYDRAADVFTGRRMSDELILAPFICARKLECLERRRKHPPDIEAMTRFSSGGPVAKKLVLLRVVV